MVTKAVEPAINEEPTGPATSAGRQPAGVSDVRKVSKGRDVGFKATPIRAMIAGQVIGSGRSHTDARNDILGCFGRSHRRAQGDRLADPFLLGWS